MDLRADREHLFVDSADPGAVIVEARACLDSAVMAWTVMRDEQLRAGRALGSSGDP